MFITLLALPLIKRMTEEDMSIARFFSQNSNLFTVLGVFGAISVYVTQLELASRWRRLGIVSSLTIFILIAIAIQRNFPSKSSDQAPFDFVIQIGRQQTPFLMFYVAFYALLISIAAIVLQFSNTLIFLFQFIVFIFGIGATRVWISLVGDPDRDLTLGEDEHVIQYSKKMALHAFLAFLFGGSVLVVLWLQGWIPIQQLVAFQVKSPLVAIVIGFFSGLLVGGVLWMLLAVLILTLDYSLRKMKAMGFYDEEWNFNPEALVETEKENGERED